jgi:hypothetical protein
MTEKSRDLPADLAAARTRIEKWRSGGPARRRLPEEVWEMAADLVPRHGVYRVSRALRLEYYKVRDRAEARQAERKARPEPAFVQVAAPAPAMADAVVGCTIELSDQSGRRMVIRCAAGVDAARLVAVFSGAAS